MRTSIPHKLISTTNHKCQLEARWRSISIVNAHLHVQLIAQTITRTLKAAPRFIFLQIAFRALPLWSSPKEKLIGLVGIRAIEWPLEVCLRWRLFPYVSSWLLNQTYTCLNLKYYRPLIALHGQWHHTKAHKRASYNSYLRYQHVCLITNTSAVFLH